MNDEPVVYFESRRAFFEELARTTAEIEGLAAREPNYPVWGSILRQLRAMAEWTANGKDPTPQQRGAVSIGLICARELEPTQGPQLDALCPRLHLLNAYWREWPSA
ncbi:MAG: hypothetical protein QM820_32815 [Minicystis sp.]